MKASSYALAAALAALPLTAQGQTAAPQQMQVGAPVPTMLRVGTQVQLKLAEPLTTEGKKLRVGYRFQMVTAEPVTVDGHIVIPIDSPALGEITEVRNKGMWGKSGHLTAQLLYVTANGRQIKLSGTFDDKGVTGTAGVVAAVVFIPVVGFFTTGTSARIPLGAPVKGFIDEDVPLAFASTAPAPMVVDATPGTPAATPPAAPAK